MESDDVAGAIAVATDVAGSCGLRITDATVLHSSNRLTLRLTPCDVLARVARAHDGDAQLEVDRARRLAAAGCPVGVVHPEMGPLVSTRGGFTVSLWTYYPPVSPGFSAADYARALAGLHAGMSSVDLGCPRFTDRVADAGRVVDQPDRSPDLGNADRLLLSSTLRNLPRAILDHGAEEQLLHGEPHPGNVLSTTDGPLFVDLETLCRGPVELDLAHVPEAVSEHYPRVDHELLDHCRQLVLAVVAAWRWDVRDEFPNRQRWREELLRALRQGPPWRSIDALTPRLDTRSSTTGR